MSTTTPAAIAAEAPPVAQRPSVFAKLQRNWSVRIGVAVLALLTLIAIAAPWMGTVDPAVMDGAIMNVLPGVSGDFMLLDGRAVKHTFWMGADSFGRDIWSRVLYGTRISLVVGLFVALVSLSLGGAAGAEGAEGGLSLTPFAVPGKRPVHLEGRGPAREDDNIGLLIRDRRTERSLAYVPAVASWTSTLDQMLAKVDAVFFDGTFWSSAELVTTGVGTKRAEDMAHLPVGGPEGGLARLSRLSAAHRIFIHINNTNPMLREDSPQRAETAAAGVQIAFDGMELEL